MPFSIPRRKGIGERRKEKGKLKFWYSGSNAPALEPIRDAPASLLKKLIFLVPTRERGNPVGTRQRSLYHVQI
jgi:hypothetical protein